MGTTENTQEGSSSPRPWREQVSNCPTGDFQPTPQNFREQDGWNPRSPQFKRVQATWLEGQLHCSNPRFLRRGHPASPSTVTKLNLRSHADNLCETWPLGSPAAASSSKGRLGTKYELQGFPWISEQLALGWRAPPSSRNVKEMFYINLHL